MLFLPFRLLKIADVGNPKTPAPLASANIGNGDPPPPLRHADVLNGWSLIKSKVQGKVFGVDQRRQFLLH